MGKALILAKTELEYTKWNRKERNVIMELIALCEDMADDINEVEEYLNTMRYDVVELLKCRLTSPLTGEDDEWKELHFNDEVYDEGIHEYINKRRSTVHKITDEDGDIIECWDSYEVNVSYNGGLDWRQETMHKNVTFPYSQPLRDYVLYENTEQGGREDITADYARINALRRKSFREEPEVEKGKWVKKLHAEGFFIPDLLGLTPEETQYYLDMDTEEAEDAQNTPSMNCTPA